MLWLLALHIIARLFWSAALLYLPVLIASWLSHRWYRRLVTLGRL